MGFDWKVAALLDSYRGNATEDRLIVLPRPNGGMLLAVADGVGGRAGGGQAAQIAVDLVRTHHRGFATGLGNWSQLLSLIDDAINAEPDAGETTFVIADIADGATRGVSAGDSEAWFVTAFGVFKLTEYQQRKPFVGSGAAHPMSFDFAVPPEGGTLLVATDGLFHYVSSDAIFHAVRLPDADAAARQLVDAARGKVSRQLCDDIAVIVARAMAR